MYIGTRSNMTHNVNSNMNLIIIGNNRKKIKFYDYYNRYIPT